MPQADENGQRVAARISQRADDFDRRFQALVAALYVALRRSRSEQQSISILDEFIRDFSVLTAIAVNDTRIWAADLLAAFYGRRERIRTDILAVLADNPATAALFDPDLFNEQALMVEQLRIAVSRGTRKATEQAAVSGRPVVQEMAKLALTRSEAYNLRRILDSAVVNAAQHSIWLEGAGVFEKKIVVAVLDKDTTALCRRLDGTVWEWQELIVDPVSGGRRMFPPFVGSDFDPTYHPCRSIAVPYFG